MKLDNKKKIICLVVLVLIIILIVAVLLITKNGKNNNKNDNKNNDKKESIVYECGKKNDAVFDDRDSYVKFILTTDSEGKIIKFENAYVDYYKTDEDYNRMKNLDDADKIYRFDDSKKEVTKATEYFMKDENGNDMTIYYEGYSQNLIQNGYTCNEK